MTKLTLQQQVEKDPQTKWQWILRTTDNLLWTKDGYPYVFSKKRKKVKHEKTYTRR